MIDKNDKIEKVIYVSSTEREKNTGRSRRLSNNKNKYIDRRDKYKTKGD